MLKVISLFTIQQIFEIEAEGKLSPLAKMSYIATLMHYFQDVPANLDGCKGFDIETGDIQNPEKTLKYFEEMQDCGLVIIKERTITFLNHWNKYIDKTKLERAEPAEYLSMMSWRPAAEFEQVLLTDKSLYDLMGMQHKLHENTITAQIKKFLAEQKVARKHYASESEALKHCMYWLGNRAKDLPKVSKTTKPRLLG